jgi:hypothetical protein
MTMRRSSNILAGNPGIPGGITRTTLQAFHSCLSHLGVSSLGTTKTCNESCCLIRAIHICSKATSATADGGNQPRTPTSLELVLKTIHPVIDASIPECRVFTHTNLVETAEFQVFGRPKSLARKPEKGTDQQLRDVRE